MLQIFIGAIMCGFTYPIGEILLNKSGHLWAFTLAYILMRVVAQLPLVYRQKKHIHWNKNILGIFALSGLIGALLHWAEFKSLKTNLPISLVSILTFSFPLFIGIIDAIMGKIKKMDIVNIVLALLGVYLINKKDEGFVWSLELIFPMLASLFFAFWTILSSNLTRFKIHPQLFSFFYDLFSAFFIIVFIALMPASLNEFKLTLLELKAPLFFYAILVGVIPNLFIFYGLQKTTPLKGSFVLLFVPLVSVLASIIMFDESLSLSFILGSCLILTTSISHEVLRMAQKKMSYK